VDTKLAEKEGQSDRASKEPEYKRPRLNDYEVSRRFSVGALNKEQSGRQFSRWDSGRDQNRRDSVNVKIRSNDNATAVKSQTEASKKGFWS